MMTAEQWIESVVRLYNDEMKTTLTTDDLLTKEFGEVFKVKKPKPQKQKCELSDKEKAERKATQSEAGKKAARTCRDARIQIETPAREYIEGFRSLFVFDNGMPNFESMAKQLNGSGFKTSKEEAFTPGSVRRMFSDFEKQQNELNEESSPTPKPLTSE